MRIALEEAAVAADEGEVPLGAVLVDRDGGIICRTHNRRETDSDPTAHAELSALRTGARKIGEWRLTGHTLYVTKEPCVMCSGAMVNARLHRVVFGCRDEKGGAAESLYRLLTDRRLNHQVEVTGGVLETETREILRRFFQARR